MYMMCLASSSSELWITTSADKKELVLTCSTEDHFNLFPNCRLYLQSLVCEFHGLAVCIGSVWGVPAR